MAVNYKNRYAGQENRRRVQETAALGSSDTRERFVFVSRILACLYVVYHPGYGSIPINMYNAPEFSH